MPTYPAKWITGRWRASRAESCRLGTGTQYGQCPSILRVARLWGLTASASELARNCEQKRSEQFEPGEQSVP
ncbi:MAG: hypothetical protein QOJ99_534 [Bryobacterales bacterium]|nr:hypothetical protein [Bryobacterales bacterium]